MRWRAAAPLLNLGPSYDAVTNQPIYDRSSNQPACDCTDCGASPPPPPPPPPPGSPCGACEADHLPAAFAVTFENVSVSPNCVFYFSDGETPTAQEVTTQIFSGTFCLTQLDTAACSYIATVNRGDGVSWDATFGQHGQEFPLQTVVILELVAGTPNTYFLTVDVGGIRVFQSGSKGPPGVEIVDCMDSVTLPNDSTGQTACGSGSPPNPGLFYHGIGGTAEVTPSAPCSPPPDLCASGDGSSCPDTVHVSVTGGSFDGLEVDISKDPAGDSASTTWGNPTAFYSVPGAYIQCINGALTLTLRSDVAPDCTIQFTADGSGTCPTARSWTIIDPIEEGCTAPTSVSVT